ncbi:putative Transferase-like protein [Seiridium unicorne]|uniref:Transferase-like protein n=1 Tax=Seiridium unicorne TaxID=138068 RepID=A0ABR2V6B0_9PEZI
MLLSLLGFMANNRHRRLTKEIQSKAGTAPLMPPDLMRSAVQERVIMGGGREVDLPIELIPSHLALWFEAPAVELAKALRILLEHGVYSLGQGSAVHSIIGKEIDCDHVRITEWISPEPIAILEHPDVICYVNHGGAGAFNDAVCSGVPRITIPLWQDTFEFARRVEYLGIGRAGAQNSKDWFDAEELGSRLREVILGPRAEEFQIKARRLAQICDAEKARVAAAEEILRKLHAC